ncbi:hypothetical protein OB2597_13863 [Pseudooceanicola batsensis HTCC2597]|uniref:Uncharacterized protein n=1 Tax=Pseudooceanicola batsensis (strain ATCC BAA-863 / DSM 15984 / KCTC 12145 / HTCC2597) TaxID=252305 RepID=A3TYK1_PSEBH|nr:hypothetical protein OB2597_13863 [Pseudooceanicola batsensis HTCC2597]
MLQGSGTPCSRNVAAQANVQVTTWHRGADSGCNIAAGRGGRISYFGARPARLCPQFRVTAVDDARGARDAAGPEAQAAAA